MTTEEETPKKKKVDKLNAVILVVLIVVAGWMFLGGDVENLEYFKTSENNEPAEVVIQKFTELKSPTTVTIEIWIVNNGEEKANNINVFVRAYNQNGTLLHSANISMLTQSLLGNDTTSGLYILSIDPDDDWIYHTIEITWDSGRNIYSKSTML